MSRRGSIHPIASPATESVARRLFVRDLVIPCAIGIHDHEQGARQNVRINVDLEIATSYTPSNPKVPCPVCKKLYKHARHMYTHSRKTHGIDPLPAIMDVRKQTVIKHWQQKHQQEWNPINESCEREMQHQPDDVQPYCEFPDDDENEDTDSDTEDATSTIMSWWDLPQHRWFKVLNISKKLTEAGDVPMLILETREGEKIRMWSMLNIAKTVTEKFQSSNGEDTKLFIKSMGLKTSKSTDNQYYHFKLLTK